MQPVGYMWFPICPTRTRGESRARHRCSFASLGHGRCGRVKEAVSHWPAYGHPQGRRPNAHLAKFYDFYLLQWDSIPIK